MERDGAEVDQTRRRRRLGLGLGLATLVAALIVAGMFLWQRRRLGADAHHRQEELDRGPRVVVAQVTSTPAVRELDLPADVRAFTQATIFAKVAGYVRSMRADKGDSVRKGQVLAILEAPEIEQQVRAAIADANVKRRTFERYRQLVAHDYVSAQDYDSVKAQYEVAVASLSQVRATQAYEVLRAPFDATVTLRYVDPGALIPSGTGSTSGATPLFDLTDLRRLRLTIFVQQDLAPFVAEGDPVELRSDERPELHIAARISRITQALDPQSRAMRCEIWIDNRERLYPGTFVHARMRLKAPPRPMIPSNAVVVRDGKTWVALVENGRIRLVPVDTGLDDGKRVQLIGGEVRSGQLVALDLPGEVGDGARIQTVQPETQPARGQGPPGAAR